MKKKGLVRIIFGYILAGFQVLGMIGSAINYGSPIPPHPVDGYSIPYLIGYFLPGIIGVLLLVFGYKARKNSSQ